MTFYNEVIAPSPFYNASARVHDINLLEPATRAAVEEIMKEAEADGHPLILFETYRSQRRQTLLYNQGSTQLKVVGCHHYGLAADLVKNDNGNPSWAGDFKFLGVLVKKHGMVWGGDWHGFVDSCHLQRITLADQTRLFDGTWYPDAEYTSVLTA